MQRKGNSRGNSLASSEVSLMGVPFTKVKLKSSEWEGRDGVACDEAEEDQAGPAAAAAVFECSTLSVAMEAS